MSSEVVCTIVLVLHFSSTSVTCFTCSLISMMEAANSAIICTLELPICGANGSSYLCIGVNHLTYFDQWHHLEHENLDCCSTTFPLSMGPTFDCITGHTAPFFISWLSMTRFLMLRMPKKTRMSIFLSSYEILLFYREVFGKPSCESTVLVSFVPEDHTYLCLLLPLDH